jgi:GDP-4-dehydro-6-deoxy-D-mannose reductase
VEIEKEKREPVIYVGNLEARRDFTDVRDIARAYWLSLEKGIEGEVYNIGTGKTYSIHEILQMLLSLAQIDVKIEVDPTRLRPSDVPVLLSDSAKFRKLTGWEPKIPFSQSLQDLLDYWRERI